MSIPTQFNKMGINKGDDMPTEGLVFYAPLTNNFNDLFGKTLTTYGNVETNNIIDGIHCVKLNSSTFLYTNDSTNFPIGNANVSLSIWYKHANDDFISPQMFFHYGTAITPKQLEIGVYQNHWHWNIYNNPYEDTFGTPNKEWHNMILVKNTSDNINNVSMFIDGVLQSTKNIPYLDITFGSLIFGSRETYPNCVTYGCYLTAARIYNRVLTQSEIQQLAAEFIPTT